MCRCAVKSLAVRTQDMMCLHKHGFIKVTSMQLVKLENTLKLTHCHTQNESRSIEVSGTLHRERVIYVVFLLQE